MKTKQLTVRNLLMALAVLLGSVAVEAQAQTTVLTEDFSGATNIFGVTGTEAAANSAFVYNTNLSGFGPVLAVCNTTAIGTIAGTDGQPVAADGVDVTAEWDAFHGYLSGGKNNVVSLLNSDGETLVSYAYNSGNCTLTEVYIGGSKVESFAAFNFQSRNGSNGANGFGGNGRPYVATAGNNPHISITMTPSGSITIDFTRQGATTTVLGTVGSMKKDVAQLTVYSPIGNTDRCYAIDNITVTTATTQEDPDAIPSIISATITGEEKMTFGPDPDTAFENLYTVVITGSNGTTINEQTLHSGVNDFKVVWDIDGFQTANDTEGQYCDSYGSFSVNGEGKAATVFMLRNVPMNFFGRMTATITYNGTTTVAQKYVVAQGDLTHADTQVLPLAGYPADFSTYPTALDGYTLMKETYGNGSDLIVGGWCVAGSDGATATLSHGTDGTGFVRLNAPTANKSHVLTQKIASPAQQVIFTSKLRFNNAGGVVTLTGGYPFWSSSKYTCPVSLNFNGTAITLNGTKLTSGDNDAQFATGQWYLVTVSADKTTETCYAIVQSTDGELLGKTDILPWAETSTPEYFSVGMGNSNTGSIDMAACQAYIPAVASFTLAADKLTLSIPQKEQAVITATVVDENGMPVTGLAIWTVVEDDMKDGITITTDATDSHMATITLTDAATAGTATIQVAIGGVAKTIALTLTTSEESIKFTKSTASIAIPLDENETATASFAAQVIDGEGNALDSSVTLAAFAKDGITAFTNTGGVSFDAATGLLTVTAAAQPMTLVIRATGKNSNNEELTKSVTVNIHGMKFDFGYATDDAIAEGYTVVSASTAYTDVNGYGLVSGTATAGGTQSTSNANADYLSGAIGFNIKVQEGAFYDVEITYQGVLTTGYVNSDLAGYELGTQTSLATATYTIPATTGVIDLRIATTTGVSEARIASIVVTKQAPRQKRSKRRVHHIGDSTSANNGSWAYRLSKSASTYTELFELCDFQNNGAGGRNLSTYYTQGKLAAVLRDIYPEDIVMFGNNGTNGMGSSFEADMNYYLDAAEALGAQIIINSYTPHGAVGNYSGGYDATTHTFNSYRKDAYETVVRKVAAERAQNDDNYIGFVEIGMNADAIFNAYVADYAANGYASADAAAQAIISCFTDHNHYSNGTLACDLMLGGYPTCEAKGIVDQLVDLLGDTTTGIGRQPSVQPVSAGIYDMQGRKVADNISSTASLQPGLYIVAGRKVVIK
ncbi:MAG: hypothetical protein IJT98_03610 [Prevotella sp.]|nr:hypothetical protein [Prevotella sp.]